MSAGLVFDAVEVVRGGCAVVGGAGRRLPPRVMKALVGSAPYSACCRRAVRCASTARLRRLQRSPIGGGRRPSTCSRTNGFCKLSAVALPNTLSGMLNDVCFGVVRARKPSVRFRPIFGRRDGLGATPANAHSDVSRQTGPDRRGEHLR